MGDQTAGANKQPPEILDWIQCFSIYIAIISGSKPKRTADVIGYQSIIIGASQLSHEGRWILYNRCFHLKALASRTRQWSTINITIWNMAFPNRAIQSHPGQGFDLRLIILSVCLAKTSLFQREGQSAWIGMIAPMVVHGQIAVTNTYATGAFTASRKRTSITKHPNALLLSAQPSKVKDLAPYCHKLVYLFLSLLC